jgi:formaldehyde-activating enzyme involved in methanogenesis
MVRPGSLVRVLLVLTLIASGVAYAQNQVKPNQLLVFISAVDASGAPVTDLKPEEVAMTEDGAPGKVVSLDRHQLPVKLTIAIDNGKDSTTALTSLRTGLTGLVEALPPDVEVTLVTMSQPQTVVRPTTDRAQITQGISRFGPDPRAVAKFSETLVEYSQRIDKDFKDKKLTYVPMLVVVSTSTPELEDVQPDSIQKALNTLQTRGARVSVIMFTTTPTNTESVANMKQGRQALIAAPIVKASRGKFETLVQFNQLETVLPAWGKEIAASHTKQTNQFRAVIDRPGGATGALNKPGLKITRPGVNGTVSPDGRFIE